LNTLPHKMASAALEDLWDALLEAQSADTVEAAFRAAPDNEKWADSPDSLVWAAANDNVLVLEWLRARRAASEHPLVPRDCEPAFEAAVKCSCAGALEWLGRHGFIAPGNEWQKDAIAHASKNGRLRALEWFEAAGFIDLGDRACRRTLLVDSIKYEQYKVTKWLIERGILERGDFTQIMLYGPVVHGHYWLLEWVMQDGRGTPAWFGAILVVGLYTSGSKYFAEWVASVCGDIAEAVSCVPRREIPRFLIGIKSALHLEAFTLPAVLGRILLAAKTRTKRFCRTGAATREACLAEHSRVLREIGRRKNAKPQLRALAVCCRLTRSDFAAVGAQWPA
jgi:hypothetical protein